MATAMPGSPARMVLAVGTVSQGHAGRRRLAGLRSARTRGQVTGADPAPGGRAASSYPQPAIPHVSIVTELYCAFKLKDAIGLS
jgi:hypothetical protein